MRGSNNGLAAAAIVAALLIVTPGYEAGAKPISQGAGVLCFCDGDAGSCLRQGDRDGNLVCTSSGQNPCRTSCRTTATGTGVTGPAKGGAVKSNTRKGAPGASP